MYDGGCALPLYSAPVPDPAPSVFISYRRDGGADVARLIQSYLEGHGFRVFLDVDELGTGHFDAQILKQIENCEHFLMICSPGALERCSSPDDWVRREIAHAIQCSRKIVPVTLAGFRWPPKESLPAEIAPFIGFNSFEYSHTHWKLSGRRLLGMLGARPGDTRSDVLAPSAILEPGSGTLDAPKLAQSVDDRLAILRIREYREFLARLDISRRHTALWTALRETQVLPADATLRREAACARAEFALELEEAAACLDPLEELREPDLLIHATEQQLSLIVKLERVIAQDSESASGNPAGPLAGHRATTTEPELPTLPETPSGASGTGSPSTPPTSWPPSSPPSSPTSPTTDPLSEPVTQQDPASSPTAPKPPIEGPNSGTRQIFSRFFLVLGAALLTASLVSWLAAGNRHGWEAQASFAALRTISVTSAIAAWVACAAGVLVAPRASKSRTYCFYLWLLGLVWTIVVLQTGKPG